MRGWQWLKNSRSPLIKIALAVACFLSMSAAIFNYYSSLKARAAETSAVDDEEETVAGTKIRPAITPSGWLDSYSVALQQARAANLPVLLYFTGSDWCGPCIEMKTQIFSRPEFEQWARQNVIRLYIDFPKLHDLPTAVRKQNTELLEKFNVPGVPQIFFLAPDGEKLVNLPGYVPIPVAEWIDFVSLLLPKTRARSVDLATALQAEKPALIVAAPDDNKFADELLKIPEIIRNSADSFSLVRINPARLSGAELAAWKKLTQDGGDSLNSPRVIFREHNGQIRLIENDAKPVEAVARAALAHLSPSDYRGEWLADYAQGLRIARRLNRSVLLMFVAQDVPDNHSDNSARLLEILDSEKIKKYAADNLVLVKINFTEETPATTDEESTEKYANDLTTRNVLLAQAFGLTSLPVAVILSVDGMPQGALYYDGDDGDYLQTIVDTVEKQPAVR